MRAPSTATPLRLERIAATSGCAWCQGDGVARIAGVVVVCACRPFDLDALPDAASCDTTPALSGARC